MVETKKRRSGLNPVRVLSGMRKELSLPTANETKPVKITRKVVRHVAIEVWKKYPQSLIDPNHELGELTLALVNQEIKQRLDDLKRGIVVKQEALRDYFN